MNTTLHIFLILITTGIAYGVLRAILHIIVERTFGTKNQRIRTLEDVQEVLNLKKTTTSLEKFLITVVNGLTGAISTILILDAIFDFGEFFTTITIGSVGVATGIILSSSSKSSNWSSAWAFMLADKIKTGQYVFVEGTDEEMSFVGLNSIYEVMFLKKDMTKKNYPITMFNGMEYVVIPDNGAFQKVSFPVSLNAHLVNIESTLLKILYVKGEELIQGISSEEGLEPFVHFSEDKAHGLTRADLYFWVPIPRRSWELRHGVYSKGVIALNMADIPLCSPSTFWYQTPEITPFSKKDYNVFNPVEEVEEELSEVEPENIVKRVTKSAVKAVKKNPVSVVNDRSDNPPSIDGYSEADPNDTE